MNAAPAWQPERTRILTRTEIAAVLADIARRGRRSVNSRQNGIVFRLATCCGLRAQELTGINLGDVRVDSGKPHIVVRKAVAKGGKARRVPLHWDAGTLEALRAWKAERKAQGAGQGDPFVCAQSAAALGNRLDRRKARDRFRDACKVLGAERLESLTVHDGRHSFVSHALAGGRSLAEVRDAAGHSNVATTSIYLHVVTDDGDDVGDLFLFG